MSIAVAPPLQAADPQPYSVTLAPTGDESLDTVIRDISTLIELRDKAPVAGFALVQRANVDATRFQEALRSYGYYKAAVEMKIAGALPNDPNLPGVIDAAPPEPPLPVAVNFNLGPRFLFGQIQLEGAVPTGVAASLNLAEGQEARAAEVLAARDRLLAAMREAGYPLATVILAPAVLHLDRNTMDVVFQTATGPHASLGPIDFSGLRDMNEAFLRRRLTIHPGEQFSPAAIEEARRDLVEIGVFSTVRIVPADGLNSNGDLPLRVDVVERPLRAIDLGAAWSTDLGGSFSASWLHRNLRGGAEQLHVSGAVQLGGNATRKPGYNFGVRYLQPDVFIRDLALEISLNAVKESLWAYDRTALIERVALVRKLSPHWSIGAGVQGTQAAIEQAGVKRSYHLIGLPIIAKYDSTGSLLNPIDGIRASFSVTPTQSLGHPGGTFFIVQGAGSTYIDVLGDGRSVIALRGLIGRISGVGVFGLPPDQRFYAGGSATVRGYRFQSIGPQFGNNRPVGGTAVSAGSFELRQRIFESFGVAAFVDAGQVSTDGQPFSGTPRVGAGAGLRYYSPIGPIRLDVAAPLNRQPGGDNFQVYIGIGQAF